MSEKLEFDLAVKNNGLSKALDDSAKKADNLGDVLSTALGVFAGGVALKAASLLTDAIGSLVSIGKEAVKAAADQEVATNNLNNALARSGNLTRESAADFAEFASQMQKTTVYQDDAVLSSLALLQSLSRLNSDGLKEGVKAASDFATVVGVDLETATRLVAKASEGNVSAFARYNVVIREGKTDTETYANTLKALGNFSGAATSQLNTFSGSLKATQNAYADLLEPIGDIVVKNPLVIATFSGIKDVLNKTNEAISGNTTALQDFVKVGILFTIDAIQFLFDGLDGLTRIFKFLGNAAIITGLALQNGIIAPLSLLIDAAIALGSYIPGVGKFIGDLQNPISETANALQEKMVVAFEDLKASADDNVFTSLSLDVEDFGKKVLETSAVVAAAQDKLAKNQAKTEKPIDPALLQKREELNLDILALDQQLALEQKSLSDAYAAQSLTDLTARKVAEAEATYQNELAKINILADAEFQKTQFIKDSEEKRLTQQKIDDANSLAQAKLRAQKELAIASAKRDREISDQATFFETAKTLSSAKNKELALIGKSAALVELAIKSEQAIGSSYAFGTKTGGPILGAVFAGIAATAMAAQAAKVAGIGLAGGGVVGGEFNGAAGGSDNVSITARKDEMFLNGEQQKKLFDMINGGQMSGGNIQVIIDGREIAVAVRNQIQSGFRLA